MEYSKLIESCAKVKAKTERLDPILELIARATAAEATRIVPATNGLIRSKALGRPERRSVVLSHHSWIDFVADP